MSIFPFIIIISKLTSILSYLKLNYLKNKKNIIRKLDSTSEEISNIENINKTIIIGESGYFYITNSIDENGQLFIESRKDNSRERYVYALKNDGRQYYSNSPINKYRLGSSIIFSLDSYYTNAIIVNSNGEKYLFSINYYNLEVLDLFSSNLNNNLYKSSLSALPDLLSISSDVNSLFKLKDEDSFIFAYFHRVGLVYRFVLIKGSLTITSSQITYNIPIIKAPTISSFSTSLSCFETTGFINCFYVDGDELLTISIFSKDLEFVVKFHLETSASSNNKNNFRKGIFLRDETCAYFYYRNNYKKPFVLVNSLIHDNENDYSLKSPIEDIYSIYLSVEENTDNSCDLNDLIKINENRFASISSLEDKKRVLIYLFDLYNNDKSIIIRKYKLDLEGRDIYSNLRLFLFRNYLGFNYCYGNKENCAFRILSYANTTDYNIVNDFLMKLSDVNPLNFRTNILIENNLFGYDFNGTIIISLPEFEKTGISIAKSINLEEIKVGDILRSTLIFSYVGNKTITEGNYIVKFAPMVSERSYEEFNSKSEIYIMGNNVTQESEFISQIFIGRYGYFYFNLIVHEDFKCHGNCYSCYKGYISDNEQFCIKCIKDYYFIENTENCFKDPIGYYLNPEKNVYSSCYSLCDFCYSKEINSTYMNCKSCKFENYKFYPKNRNCLNCPKYVNYEQTECANEISNGYYLYDAEYGIIEKCHELCSKCTKGPTYSSMNCDYCKEGYNLKIDNKNNKNCFPESEPIKNYFQIDIELKIFYECYELCGTCDNFGNSTNMNCLTCIDEVKYEIDLPNKVCFPNISCNYSYYYYSLDENNLKTKICLGKGQFCPEILPYEIIATKECILTCSYQNLLDLICKPSNIKVDIEQMKDTFKKEIITNDEIINDVLNKEFEDVTVEGYNSTYQITTTTNQEKAISSNNDDSISNIDLGLCEDIIKKENSIDPNVSLIILKDDLKRNETFSTQVEYEVYDPTTRKVLNLSSCQNTTILIIVPLDADEKTMDLYNNAKNQGYDIFDPEDEFYNDICTVYTSEKGTDMILSDRRADILNNTPPLCEDNCQYNGTNEISKKVLCECSPKKFINSNTSEIIFSLKFFGDIFFKFDSINYKILQCYKLLYNKKNLIQNYGFYIMCIMLVIFFILIPINLSYGVYQLKIKCFQIIKEKQSYENNLGKINLQNNNEEKPIKRTKTKSTLSMNKNKPPKLVHKKTFGFHKNKNDKFQNIKPDNRKNSVNINNKIIINSINIHNNKSIVIKPLKKVKTIKNKSPNKSPQKKNARKEVKRYSIANLGLSNSLSNSKRTMDSLIPLSPGLLKNPIDESSNELKRKKSAIYNSKKETFKVNKNIKKDDIINEESESKEDDEMDEKTFYFEKFIKKLPPKEREKYFLDEELNQMEYNYALEFDKRDFTQYYVSLLRSKQLLLFTFFNANDYNIYLVKLSLLICSFSTYFMINAGFFNDSNMHKIYEDNGKYDIIYQIPYIVYSTLISSTINIIMKNLSLSQNGVIKIKQIVKISKMQDETFVFVRAFRCRMVIFNIIGLIILAFASYYITMFCAVYTNTQIHLLKDTFSSFGLSLLYPFGLYLIPGLFRIPALKAKNKDMLWQYKLSKLISII